eukprot:scaffold986_cov237-Pinguiococcus_pyrenoidosus.AAC.30
MHSNRKRTLEDPSFPPLRRCWTLSHARSVCVLNAVRTRDPREVFSVLERLTMSVRILYASQRAHLASILSSMSDVNTTRREVRRSAGGRAQTALDGFVRRSVGEGCASASHSDSDDSQDGVLSIVV